MYKRFRTLPAVSAIFAALGAASADACPWVINAFIMTPDEQIELCRQNIRFEYEPLPSFTDFECIQTTAKFNVWRHRFKNELIVVDVAKFRAAKILGFPFWYGSIQGAGYRERGDFVVYLADDPAEERDFGGTIIYLDPWQGSIDRISD